MHRHRMFMGLHSLIALAAAPIMLAMNTFFDFLLSVAPRPACPMSSFGGAAMIAGPSMTGVPGALYFGARHEAGTSRISAARNV